MKVWWEFYADGSGLVVERKREGWEFVPNAPVGRPRRKVLPLHPHPKSLSESLPDEIIIERLTLNGQELTPANQGV